VTEPLVLPKTLNEIGITSRIRILNLQDGGFKLIVLSPETVRSAVPTTDGVRK
jgi:hypothetical protein